MPSVKKVLCVEDHPDTSELIAAILSEYEVIPACCVSEAVEKMRTGLFDLVLLDYHLPDGSGIELLHQIRMFDKRTPVLFITATKAVTNEDMVRAGASGVIRKGNIDFLDNLLRNVDNICRPRDTAGHDPSLN